MASVCEHVVNMETENTGLDADTAVRHVARRRRLNWTGP